MGKLFYLAMAALLVGCSSEHVIVNIPNFAVVSPGIFRGGQPTTNGWSILRMAGITNVVKLNLPSEGSDDMALREGMVVNNFPIDMDDQFFGGIKPETINGAVAAIKSGTYVHCKHGQDRTGIVIAVYRIKTGWSKAKAQGEMLDLGFHTELHGLWDYWEDKVK